MKAAIYIRVSTDEQTKKFSIPAQERMARAFCESKGWDVYKVYTDGGYSGKNLKRPAMQEMLGEVDKFDAVIVYRLDRLSRSQIDTMTLIETYFLRNNIDFISLTETLDTTSPGGRAMIGVLAAFAQMERENTRERSIMGRIQRVRSGLRDSPVKRRNFGYDIVDGKLYINESEAAIIREVCDRFEVLQSIGKLQQEQKSQGREVITRSRIMNYLTNDLYIGYVHYLDEVHTKGIHDPIISEEQHYRIKAILESIKQAPNVNQKHRSLLSGLVICAVCGNPYHHASKGTRRHANGEMVEYRYYTCKKNRRKPELEGCENLTYHAIKLESIVLNRINSYSVEARTDEKMKDLVNTKEKIGTLAKKKERLFELYMDGSYEKGDLDPLMSEINAEIKRLEDLNTKQSEALYKTEVSKLLLENQAIDLEHFEFPEKQQFLRSVINKIVVDGERVKVYWL
ncbi:recombinase family protein [Listeria grandensis]|uniref:Recombinase family protein n=1 Tax=Listeria grandensis TaxID=1494963 RepID=A0A7X0Y5I3_9LIST|nr:recombinase family protein [Listeria grandensis]MBC1937143.1 recombinase family protein [Listeria grandensis]